MTKNILIADITPETKELPVAKDTYVENLRSAGFETEALKIEKAELDKKRSKEAEELGFTKITKEDVRKFENKLGRRKQEFDIKEVKDYQTKPNEIIPLEQIGKVTIAKTKELFDKLLVIGTKKKKARKPLPDPIVVGIYISVEEATEGRINYRNRDWYFIAGWK